MRRSSSAERASLLGAEGQASVEAALLLPSMLVLLALLLEPACLLYTRMVMEHAAAESARLALTASAEDAEKFCRRRLKAVPEASLFHVGGEDDWEIECSNENGKVAVRITGHVRPLPLFNMLAQTVLEHDGAGIVLRVECEVALRPQWLGGDSGAWSRIWD